ncbi:MAG: type III-B CRISPR module RAMP protein Cmr6 [Bacteroidia bacterium]|nr:type III-B CRISPR module RAMP protein Cmr6 [Bacteroidia bacterium]
MADNHLYNISKTALPNDTKQTLGAKLPNNFALLFNRMAHFANKEELSESGDIGSLISKEIKAHFFHKTKKGKDNYHLDLTKKWEISPDQRMHYKQFLDDYAAAIQALYIDCQPFTLKSDWRIALGMGNESVYENGFTFHPTLGIPYLPGSSLKGMTRHWAIDTGKPKTEINAIFGHENDVSVKSEEFQQGQIVFFDALPTELNQGMVQPDIINNHYPEYYAGEKYPADWLSPRPIFFLTMKEVSFQFCLGYISRIDTNGGAALLEKAQTWLQSALEESGVGAKTAVGYGRLRDKGGYNPPSTERRPKFKEGHPDKKLKKDEELEAEVTGAGKPCKATLYGYGDRKYEGVFVYGNTTELQIGDVFSVTIQPDPSGKKIQSARLSKMKLT